MFSAYERIRLGDSVELLGKKLFLSDIMKEIRRTLTLKDEACAPRDKFEENPSVLRAKLGHYWLGFARCLAEISFKAGNSEPRWLQRECQNQAASPTIPLDRQAAPKMPAMPNNWLPK